MPNSVPLLPFTSECTLAHNINIFCRIFFWLQFREIFIRKQQRKRLFLRILSSLLFVSLPSPSVRSLTALAFLALDQSLDSAYNALRVSFGLSDSVCSPISGVALAIQWQSNGNPMAIHWQWTALRSNIIIPRLPSTLKLRVSTALHSQVATCAPIPVPLIPAFEAMIAFDYYVLVSTPKWLKTHYETRNESLSQISLLAAQALHMHCIGAPNDTWAHRIGSPVHCTCLSRHNRHNRHTQHRPTQRQGHRWIIIVSMVWAAQLSLCAWSDLVVAVGPSGLAVPVQSILVQTLIWINIVNKFKTSKHLRH